MKLGRFRRTELILFTLLILVSTFLRFFQLGYSHFYGDETKALYWKKAIPFDEFFFNQRKGPFQFLLTWIVEKLSGGYDELLMRIPFAIAGVFAVVVFYLLVRKLFNWRVAIIASSLFSLSGIYIAFSRTVQYQSFVVLFGLLAVYLFLHSAESGYRKYMLLSAVSLVISFYFHYDAVFFLIPILFMFLHHRSKGTARIKDMFFYFILPLGFLLSLFYIPYFLGGYFSNNTYTYLARRFTGKDLLPNNSLYTYRVYNPSYLLYLPLLSVIPFVLLKLNYRKELLLLWFIIPLVLFQLIIMNPGTHIHNYILPLLIMAGVLLDKAIDLLKRPYFKTIFVTALFIFFSYLALVQINTYVPMFNEGYPWVESKVGLMDAPAANKKYQLFLYGFPYNRGWDLTREYMLAQEKVKTVFSNENDTIAEFYLREYTYAPPLYVYTPDYFIYVVDDQEMAGNESYLQKRVNSYDMVKEIYVDGTLTARIYRRIGL